MASPPKRKSIIYIDGFNLFYGAIKNTPFAWLDIEKLFTTLRRDDNIQTIYYFTAEMQGEKKQARQKQYLNALDTLPLVTRIDGHFKNKTVKCLFPGGTSKRKAPLLIHTVPEEKRTDVNIAIQMVVDGYEGRMETAVLVSGDSDLIPAITTIQNKFSKIQIVVYVPVKSSKVFKKQARELKQVTDTRRLPTHLFKKCQLPTTVTDAAGKVVAKKPKEWT